MCTQYFIDRAECPGCLGSVYDTVYQRPFDSDPIKQYLKDFYDPQGGVELEYLRDAHYVLRRCRDCTLVFQGQIPNPFLMQKLYEEWIDPVLAKTRDDERRDLQFHLGYAEEIAAVLAHLVTMPARTRCLDFGMGWGRWCRMARGFGCQVYGTELSNERINFAQSQGISVLSWDDIADHEFDVINTEQVFEHIAEPLSTLQYLSKALAAGGVLKISVPNGERILDLLKAPNWSAPKGSSRSLNAVAPLEHINCFNHEALVRMGQRASLKIVNLTHETQIKVVGRGSGGAGLRKRLGRLKRAVQGVFPSNVARHRGTYVFFSRA